MATRALTIDDLLFVSFNDKVIAVDRLDGEVLQLAVAEVHFGLVELDEVDAEFVEEFETLGLDRGMAVAAIGVNFDAR